MRPMFFDTYTWRARLQPLLIVALPLVLSAFPWLSGIPGAWSILGELFVWCGGAALLAQVGRDWGEKKESELFRLWGGMPTTRLLRHRDATNKVLLERCHVKLAELLPGMRIPSAQQEREDPDAADQIYETCTASLRQKTRDKKRFPLIFEENCNYGFRRNLWGMRPVGIAIAAFGTVALGIVLFVSHYKQIATSPFSFVCELGNILLLVGWSFLFTPEWVRIPAEAYAERLLAACEDL